MGILYKEAILCWLFALLLSGCTYSNSKEKYEYPKVLCDQAKRGKLKIGKASVSDSRVNAYLLGCSVGIFISEVSFIRGTHKRNNTVKVNKQALADYLLSQKLDLTYTNEDGDNLLMLVVMSFLPDSWKEKAVIKLLELGADLKAKNHNGDTALDIAKFKGNARIISLISD